MAIRNAARLKELLQHTEKSYAERERYKQLEETRTARRKTIDEAPEVAVTEFFCSCHGDYIARGGKVEFTDNGVLCAYYVSFGDALGAKDARNDGEAWKACKEKRYITDKHLDPYYRKSETLRLHRQMFADDLLQPNDPRFIKKYGDPYKKNEPQT